MVVDGRAMMQMRRAIVEVGRGARGGRGGRPDNGSYKRDQRRRRAKCNRSPVIRRKRRGREKGCGEENTWNNRVIFEDGNGFCLNR
jgi:hypothetical protein